MIKSVVQIDQEGDQGFLQFETYLQTTRNLDNSSRKIINDSRNYRNNLGRMEFKISAYTLSDIMSDYVYQLSDGEILTEYTEDDDVDDLKEEITNQGNSFYIQVHYPVSFRLVKVISTFNVIISYYIKNGVFGHQAKKCLSRDLMSYLNKKLIDNNTEDMLLSSKKESIIKWVKTNNIYCQELYRILHNWPVKTTSNFTVFTGFNFEIPDVGDSRNIIIDDLTRKNEGDIIIIPFVLSTSISPYVAKRFAVNETDIILQIIIPKEFPIPYISKKNSRELEVLLNMYGIYRIVNTNQMNSALQDIQNRVICLELVGFNKINIDQINENTTIICDIISQEMVNDKNKYLE
jgi:serine/threonine protein phosphatase PrpC